jgi:hypothetical protein
MELMSPLCSNLFSHVRPGQSLEVLFAAPGVEYRGAPFWAWNNRLNKDQLLRQVDYFREMGFGGFHIHSRTGMGTEYLSPQFMDMVRACADKANQVGMLCWLYDEDRWPSGAAGGLVTREPEFRARHLLFTQTPYGGRVIEESDLDYNQPRREENGKLLWRYEVVLKDGRLDRHQRLEDHQTPSWGGAIWYLYLETSGPSPWFNNQAYLDTLNPRAVERFIEVTHERYAEAVGDLFGTTIPAIFTDEPQFSPPRCLTDPYERKDLCIPFTDDFFKAYFDAYQERLENALPELFWELPDGKISATRYRYYDHLSERFASAYADRLGAWCQDHGVALTGHLMEESTLERQTRAVGDAMRSYRGFHIPGIDMLCDWREYNTAKQAQSAARQFGRWGVLSELYGVTNWDFDFMGHKGQGDWQAALGVTVRVPHLAWVSMAGEAKRDYPASIFYQSPWYGEYPLVEDHFARLNTVLTRGNPVVRVGLIHPIESFWLCFGPLSQTKARRSQQEEIFSRLTEWLLFGLIDFDFISESLLPSLCARQEGDRFNVGQMKYDVILVPSLQTIRSSTLERLEAFAAAGGKVMFIGEIPQWVDAQPSRRAVNLARSTRCVRFDQNEILGALAECREVEAIQSDGKKADSLLYQLREEDQRRYLFICNTDRSEPRNGVAIRLKGGWSVELWDTMTGSHHPLSSDQDLDGTTTKIDFPPCGSALLVLSRPWKPVSPTPRGEWREQSVVQGPVPVTLSEPNVLLLDQAQWRLDGGQWQPSEEILRIDNLVRERLGIPQRTGLIPQPWTESEAASSLGSVQLKFKISCRCATSQMKLAVENPDKLEIQLGGRPIPNTDGGWFVDEAIRAVPMPALTVGEHELVLTVPFTRKTNLEWCYLLGDFGVQVSGRSASIVSPVRQLAFGDWRGQGLPFYGGNVTYHCNVAGSEHRSRLRVPNYKAALLSVELDKKRRGAIAFAPYGLELGRLSSGGHALDISVFGNRFNTFGCLHNANHQMEWIGPNAWRTVGREWSYDYQLKEMGILSSPILEVQD